MDMTEQADQQLHFGAKPRRDVGSAMLLGALGRCPNCHAAPLFDGFLKVTDTCSNCGEVLSHHRADDAPPYFTIFIVGHIIVPLVIWAEVTFRPSLLMHTIIFFPLTIALALAFLRPIKGAVVGLQWANYMHGFDPHAEPDGPESDPKADRP